MQQQQQQQQQLMMQPAVQQQPAQVVTQMYGSPTVRPGFAHRKALVLGICQIIIGIVLLLLDIAATVVALIFNGLLAGSGFVSGVMFIVTGSFGIASSKKKTNCYIITSMVLSIISATFGGFIFLNAMTNLIILGSINVDGAETGSTWSLLFVLLLALAETVIAIVQSALCCRTVCCRKRQGVTLYYLPNERQQVTTGTAQMSSNMPPPPSGVALGQSYPTNPPQQMIQTNQPPQQIMIYQSHDQIQPIAGPQMYPQQQPNTAFPGDPNAKEDVPPEKPEKNTYQLQTSGMTEGQQSSPQPSYRAPDGNIPETMDASLVDNEMLS
ncbi:uncharacterized protein LOC144452913 isoform X2 [Glandiceps talaboti]